MPTKKNFNSKTDITPAIANFDQPNPMIHGNLLGPMLTIGCQHKYIL
jgi:hypothetical protein